MDGGGVTRASSGRRMSLPVEEVTGPLDKRTRKRLREGSWEVATDLVVAHADTGAPLDEAQRAKLLTRHRWRLSMPENRLADLIRVGAAKLVATDPGEGVPLSQVERSTDIYLHAAARLGDGPAGLPATLHLRHVRALCRVADDVRPPANVMAAAQPYIPVTASIFDFDRLLAGGGLASVLCAEHKAEHGGNRRYVTPVEAIDGDLDALLARAPEDLRRYLVRKGLGRVRPVPPTCAAQLRGCVNETLFGLGLLTLELALRHSKSRATYHTMLIVKQVANSAGEDDLTTLDGLDRFAVGYCIEKTRFPNDPPTRRYNVGRFLMTSHVEIDQEMKGADEADRAMLARYLLPLPRQPHEFLKAVSSAQRKNVKDGQKKRKDRVEPLVEHFPQMRFLAGSRLAELSHDRECCATALEAARALDTSGPIEVGFSYLAPVYDSDGRRLPGLQRRHWTLRNGNRVCAMLAEATGDRTDHYRLPGGPNHQERYGTDFWLTFDRSEGVDGAEARDPWLLPTVESLILMPAGGLPVGLATARAAFAASNGLDIHFDRRFSNSLAWFDDDHRRLARRMIVDLGLRPWPMDSLLHGQLIAHVGTRIMTTSGARTHEVFQLAQDKSRFFRLENLPGREIRYVFLATPKNFTEAVPFVIQQDDVKAVNALARFASARFHGGGPLPVTKPPLNLEVKCAPNRFVMNKGALPATPEELNPLVQILFVGKYDLEAYDLRHGFASYAETVGIPILTIAAWLNQKALDVTRYYAKPGRAAKDRWWLQFHTTIDLREFQAAGAQVLEAEKVAALAEVGALTSVVGGTCVSLSECPARFMCVGCRANSPDPAKRAEVEDSREAAVGLRDVWGRHGRGKAVAEQEAAIARHDAMLREMELIERYRQMRDEKVVPEHVYQVALGGSGPP